VETSIEELIDRLFHKERRFIKQVRANSNFKMPGNYMAKPNISQPGYTDRMVYAGQKWFLRFQQNSDKVIVEVIKDESRPFKIKSDVYQLTRLELDKIKRRIDL